MCNLSRNTFLAVRLTGTIFPSVPHSQAQNPALQEKLTAIKESSAANKQALAHYTWLEQQTISLKGEVKKTQQFQAQIGPDGQQQKTELNPQPAPQPSGGRLRHHVVEKKTDEFEAYGQQIAALGKQYAQLDVQAVQQAYQQGNVSMQPNSAAGTVSLIIKSYLKPNDSVTLVFNQQQKAIQSVQVASYLTDPSDAVTIAVQFAKLPDGTNHVATTQVKWGQQTAGRDDSEFHVPATRLATLKKNLWIEGNPKICQRSRKTIVQRMCSRGI